MGLSKEDLLAHSRYIRNTLAPGITRDPLLLSGNNALDLTTVRSTLHELEHTPMTTEVLRFSRIGKALQRVVESSGVGWPPDIVIKAQMLLARWEELLGPLQRVRTDLWAAGGRLEGFVQPKTWRRPQNGQLPVSDDLKIHIRGLTEYLSRLKHLLGPPKHRMIQQEHIEKGIPVSKSAIGGFIALRHAGMASLTIQTTILRRMERSPMRLL